MKVNDSIIEIEVEKLLSRDGTELKEETSEEDDAKIVIEKGTYFIRYLHGID